MSTPVLVGCAHGTRDGAGRRAIARLLLAVRAARPGLPVQAAYVDVQPPAVADVVASVLASGRRAVVVPLLLSAGYHVHVDIASAVASSAGRASATGALGPDLRLIDLLATRLEQAGWAPDDAVVLAAAGSSDARAARDVEVTRRGLAARRPGPVLTAFTSSAEPSVPEAVAALRAAGSPRVAVAAYLLGPGHLHDRLAPAGADLVTAPLLAGPVDDRLVSLVLERYDAAAG